MSRGIGHPSARSVSGMSLIVIVAATTLTAGTVWSWSVLTDEVRYLRAVSALATSPRFARLAGTTITFAARHRSGWRRGLPRVVARAMGSGTRRTMGTTTFRRSWIIGHRLLHRHRPQRWRVAASMVALATMGALVTATSHLSEWMVPISPLRGSRPVPRRRGRPARRRVASSGRLSRARHPR